MPLSNFAEPALSSQGFRYSRNARISVAPLRSIRLGRGLTGPASLKPTDTKVSATLSCNSLRFTLLI